MVTMVIPTSVTYRLALTTSDILSSEGKENQRETGDRPDDRVELYRCEPEVSDNLDGFDDGRNKTANVKQPLRTTISFLVPTSKSILHIHAGRRGTVTIVCDVGLRRLWLRVSAAAV